MLPFLRRTQMLLFRLHHRLHTTALRTSSSPHSAGICAKANKWSGLAFISLTCGSSSSSLFGLCPQEKPAQGLPTAAISKRETETNPAFLTFLTQQLLICLHRTDTALIRLVCTWRWVKKKKSKKKAIIVIIDGVVYPVWSSVPTRAALVTSDI